MEAMVVTGDSTAGSVWHRASCLSALLFSWRHCGVQQANSLHGRLTLQKPGEKKEPIMLDSLSLEVNVFCRCSSCPPTSPWLPWVVTGDSTAGSVWHRASVCQLFCFPGGIVECSKLTACMDDSRCRSRVKRRSRSCLNRGVKLAFVWW